MVAKLSGVPVARALLLVAVDLSDETVDVDHQSLCARACAGVPRAAQGLGEDTVELADMPEAEPAQEHPERRGRHRTMSEYLLGAPGTERCTIIDAVRAQEHREHERGHLPAGTHCPRPVAEPHLSAHLGGGPA